MKSDRKGADPEPVFHYTTPVELHEDILMGVSPHAVVGLTCMDASEAFAMMKRSVPYVGLCFTETHQRLVMDRLSSLVFESMRTEGSHFYDATAAKALVAAGLPPLSATPLPKSAPAPRSSPAKKNKGEALPGDEEAGKDGSTKAKRNVIDSDCQTSAKRSKPASNASSSKPQKSVAQQMKEALAALSGQSGEAGTVDVDEEQEE